MHAHYPPGAPSFERRRLNRPPVGLDHRKRDHGGVLFIDLRDHYG